MDQWQPPDTGSVWLPMWHRAATQLRYGNEDGSADAAARAAPGLGRARMPKQAGGLNGKAASGRWCR